MGTDPRVLRLLRNDHVSCRIGAFGVMRAFVQERPPVQECSEPTAVDPLHAATSVLSGVVSPHVAAGDAAAGADSCPQGPASGRVLIVYELDEPPPACLTTLRVAKSGSDVVLTW
jgi:hypothetical protein